MKKTSKSILPVEHIAVDNLKSSYDSIKNSVPSGSTDNKQLLKAVYRILEKYRKCQESTQDKRDDLLVNFIMSEFESLLKPYIDNYTNTIGLEAIVTDALSDVEVSESEIKKITKDIKTSIKKLQVKNQTESTTTNQVIDKKSLKKQFEDNLDDIFDDIKKSTNPKLDKYRKDISKINNQHTKDIIALYQKQCQKFYDKLTKNKTDKDKKLKKQQTHTNIKVKEVKEDTTKNKKSNNLVNKTINPLHKAGIIGKTAIDSIKKKTKNILEKKFVSFNKLIENKKIYFLYINEAFKKLKNKLKNIFSSIFDKIKKVGGFLLTPIALVVKWTILPLAKLVVKIGGGIVKGVKFLAKGLFKVFKLFKLDVLIKGVYKSVIAIGKLVGKAAKNTLVAFLMTPKGAYIAGFILGFLWTKIKNVFKGEGKLTQIFKTVKNKIFNFFEPIFNPFKEFFFGILNDYIQPVINFFAPLFKSMYSGSKGVLEWILGHKLLVTTIITLSAIIEKIISGVMMCRKVFKCCGNPLSGLIAAGIVSIYYGIKNIFAWRKDEDFRLAKGKSKLMGKFTGANEIAIKGMSEQDQKNYGELSNKVSKEKFDLDQLINDIDQLKEEYEKDESTTLDLSKSYPEFVESVFDSELFGNDRTELKKFKKFAKGKRVYDQLRELIKYVNKRYDKIIIIQSGLTTSKTSAELQKMLSRVADFSGGKITISQNVADVASQIKHDDLDGNEKEWNHMSTWLNNPETAAKKAQFYGDKLAGKKFTYKVDTHYVQPAFSAGPGASNYGYTVKGGEISEQAYVNNISSSYYHRVEVGGSGELNGQVDELLKGYDGEEKQKAIIKNYLLSNSKDIEQLKQLDEGKRNARILEILNKWSEQNEKTEEQRQKEEEERVRKEIEDLEIDTQNLITRNKELQNRIDTIKKQRGIT